MDCSVIPLSSPADVEVVDVSLQHTVDVIANLSSGDIILASHDTDFLSQIGTLLDQGYHIAIMCFREFLSSQLHELGERSLEIVDLEYDVYVFQVCLPRLHIVDVDDLDLISFL